jgi:hypothetical protein
MPLLAEVGCSLLSGEIESKIFSVVPMGSLGRGVLALIITAILKMMLLALSERLVSDY